MFSLVCGCLLLTKLKMFAKAQEAHERLTEGNLATTPSARAAD
jgi:hypothetical protein